MLVSYIYIIGIAQGVLLIFNFFQKSKNNQQYFWLSTLIFAATLIIGQIFFNKNFLKLFFKNAFQLDEMGWNKLNFRWAYFFIFLALLNEFVWRTQSEIIWVNFKVWGILPLTFIFTAIQIPMINKHKI